MSSHRDSTMSAMKAANCGLVSLPLPSRRTSSGTSFSSLRAGAASRGGKKREGGTLDAKPLGDGREHLLEEVDLLRLEAAALDLCDVVAHEIDQRLRSSGSPRESARGEERRRGAPGASAAAPRRTRRRPCPRSSRGSRGPSSSGACSFRRASSSDRPCLRGGRYTRRARRARGARPRKTPDSYCGPRSSHRSGP